MVIHVVPDVLNFLPASDKPAVFAPVFPVSVLQLDPAAGRAVRAAGEARLFGQAGNCSFQLRLGFVYRILISRFVIQNVLGVFQSALELVPAVFGVIVVFQILVLIVNCVQFGLVGIHFRTVNHLQQPEGSAAPDVCAAPAVVRAGFSVDVGHKGSAQGGGLGGYAQCLKGNHQNVHPVAFFRFALGVDGRMALPGVGALGKGGADVVLDLLVDGVGVESGVLGHVGHVAAEVGLHEFRTAVPPAAVRRQRRHVVVGIFVGADLLVGHLVGHIDVVVVPHEPHLNAPGAIDEVGVLEDGQRLDLRPGTGGNVHVLLRNQCILTQIGAVREAVLGNELGVFGQLLLKDVLDQLDPLLGQVIGGCIVGIRQGLGGVLGDACVDDELLDVGVAAAGVPDVIVKHIPAALDQTVVFLHGRRAFAVGLVAEFHGEGIQVRIGVPHQPVHEPVVEVVHAPSTVIHIARRTVHAALGGQAQEPQICVELEVLLHLLGDGPGINGAGQAGVVVVDHNVLGLFRPAGKIFLHRGVGGRRFDGQMVVAVDGGELNDNVVLNVHRRGIFTVDVSQRNDLQLRIHLLELPGRTVQEVEEDGGLVIVHVRGHSDAVVGGEGLRGQIHQAAVAVRDHHAEVLVILNAVRNVGQLVLYRGVVKFLGHGVSGFQIVEVQVRAVLGLLGRAVGVGHEVLGVLLKVLVDGKSRAAGQQDVAVGGVLLSVQLDVADLRAHGAHPSVQLVAALEPAGGHIDMVLAGGSLSAGVPAPDVEGRFFPVVSLDDIDGGGFRVKGAQLINATGPEDSGVFFQEVVDAVENAAALIGQNVNLVVQRPDRKAVGVADPFQIVGEQLFNLGNGIRSRQNDFQTLAAVLGNGGQLCAADLLHEFLQFCLSQLHQGVGRFRHVDFRVGCAVDGEFGQVCRSGLADQFNGPEGSGAPDICAAPAIISGLSGIFPVNRVADKGSVEPGCLRSHAHIGKGNHLEVDPVALLLHIGGMSTVVGVPFGAASVEFDTGKVTEGIASGIAVIGPVVEQLICVAAKVGFHKGGAVLEPVFRRKKGIDLLRNVGVIFRPHTGIIIHISNVKILLVPQQPDFHRACRNGHLVGAELRQRNCVGPGAFIEVAEIFKRGDGFFAGVRIVRLAVFLRELLIEGDFLFHDGLQREDPRPLRIGFCRVIGFPDGRQDLIGNAGVDDELLVVGVAAGDVPDEIVGGIPAFLNEVVEFLHLGGSRAIGQVAVLGLQRIKISVHIPEQLLHHPEVHAVDVPAVLGLGFAGSVAHAFRADAHKALFLQVVQVFLDLLGQRTGVILVEQAVPVAVDVQVLGLLAPLLDVLLHPHVSGRSLDGQMVVTVQRRKDDVDVLCDVHCGRNLGEDVGQGVDLHVGILFADNLGHPVQEVIEHGGLVVFVLGVHGDAVIRRKGLPGQLHAVFVNHEIVAVTQGKAHGRLIALLEELADFVGHRIRCAAVVEVQLGEAVGAFFRGSIRIAQIVFRMLVKILVIGQPVGHDVAQQQRLKTHVLEGGVGAVGQGRFISGGGDAVLLVSRQHLVEGLPVALAVGAAAANGKVRNLQIIRLGDGDGCLGVIQGAQILVGTGPDDACVFRQEVVDAVLHAALIGAEDVDPVVHSTNRKAVQLANGFQIFRKQFLDLGNGVRSRQNDFQTLAGMLRNDGELCAADLLGDVLQLLGGKLQKRFPGSGQVDFGVGFAIDGQMGQVHFSRDQTGNGRFQIRLRAVHSSLIHILVFQNRQSHSQGALESAPAFIGVADVFFVLVRIVKAPETALVRSGLAVAHGDGDFRQNSRLRSVRQLHQHGDNGAAVCLGGDHAAVADRYRSIAALVADSSGKLRNGVGFAGVQFHSGGNVHGGLAAALRAVQDGAGPVLRDGHKIDVFKLPGILLPFPGGQGNGEILPVDQHRILHDDPRDLGKDLRGVV